MEIMEIRDDGPRPYYYRSVLQQTVDAFYDAAIAEITRLARRPPTETKQEEQPKQEARQQGTKRMNRTEAAKHRTLVRWLLAHRRRNVGCKLEEIGEELGVTRQRAEQILTSPEPVRWNR